MRKYSPRIITYIAIPLLACAAMWLPAPAVVAAPCGTWTGYLLMSLYYLGDKMDLVGMFSFGGSAFPPRRSLLTLIGVGLVGCLTAALIDSEVLAALLMIMNFTCIEALLRDRERKFDTSANHWLQKIAPGPGSAPHPSRDGQRL